MPNLRKRKTGNIGSAISRRGFTVKMDFREKISDWSEAHVFYNLFTHKPAGDSSRDLLNEYKWRMEAMAAPNGSLLTENSVFDLLRKNNKLYFLHVTPNLKKILENGSIYSSGGCLMGAVYATPLFQDKGRLRLHNLGKYIYEKEAPRALYYSGSKNKLDGLVVEVVLPRGNHENLIGIDYTKLGKVHLNIYRELEYLLSFEERLRIYKILIDKTRKSMAYLDLVHNAYFYDREIDPEEFFRLFVAAVENLPILGYLYFEVVAEYLLLFQDCPSAIDRKKIGEFCNFTYKDLMFDFFPSLLKSTSLSIFSPSIERLAGYIEKKKIISNLDRKKMVDYMARRLTFLTNTRLLNSDNPDTAIHWLAMKWDFEHLTTVAPGLLGHLIHRELRNFGRYPDFYFYFDQFKALQAWNYWNHMDIAIPFNGFIPKGETGINPAATNLKYKIYSAKITSDKIFSFAEPQAELPVKLVPRLVDIRFTTMRSKAGKHCSNENNGW